MPNCEQLIIDIQETIRENGNNEITGPILQDVLVDMVYALCGEQQSFDELKMWSLLSAATPEQINVSHLSATDVAGMLTQAGYKLTDTTYALATDAVAGLLKTGFAENGKNYAVKLDDAGRAYVNVPWKDKFDTYFGVDEDGNIYVKDNRGFWSSSFISARGSDPEADGGASGVDMDAVWDALAAGTTEKINVSHLSATDLASLLTSAGYKLTDTIYTLPKATVSTLGGIKAAGVRASAITTTQGGTTSGRYYGVELDSNGKAFVNVPWVNTTYSLSSFGITATAAELNKLDGLATTAKELGYVHGVTSAIQTQLNSKANASALASYLPLSGGTVTGNIVFSGATNATSSIKMSTDTSNYRVGVQWESKNEGTKLGEIGYWNAQQRIYLNALADEVTEVWTDTVGKYSLVVGKNLLTYNTYPLLHSANYTNYTVTKTGGGASGTWGINISGNAKSATSATKLATARTLWSQSFDGSGNISGDMTGVGLINGALHIAEQGDDLVKLRTRNHYLEFSGYGYMHKSYYFRPGYSSAGATNAGVYIQNASASDNPTFTTTHAFDANGNATHKGALTVAGAGYFSGLLTASAGLTTPQYVQVGSGRLKWDAANNALYVEKSDGTACGLYSKGYLSARGSDPESGSSGSGLDEDAMWDALAAGTSEQINVSHIPALNISKITGLQSALDGKLNNGSTTYDTAYARNLTINGITYGIWATANPAALGPFYIPTSAGTSGYILQSTGGVPGWISRAALTQQLFSGGKGCVAIPENSDLNDYTTPGLYYYPANATVRTLANVPVTGAFSLEILQAAGVIQILREYGYSSNANDYTRRYYNGSWTTWVRAPRLNELYTKTEADGRYLKLAGGTMTGNLTARDLIVPGGYYLYGVKESGGAMVGFANGRTQLGSIGASTTAATHIRSITGHITAGSSDAATYHVLDSGNYTSYTVTKTGGGASGTWGINISGNAKSATSATKLATARTLWSQSFDGSGNISGDMTGVGLINGALHIAEQGDNLVKLRTRNHYLEFSGYGYMHKSYYFRPGYSSAGATNAGVYIQNASASDNPTFTTTHAFDANGNATHKGALTVAGAGYFSGLLTASAGLTTPQYVQVGSGRLKWDAANNALYVEKSDGTPCGLYSKGYMSARGSDPEAATGGSSELVPVVTLSKLTVGTNVSISVLANAGLTNDVLEKMRDGAVGRIKAVFSDGSTEIWPVLHASENFISFGYDTVAGGYMDTMDIYEITIPSKTSVIRVEHFER